MDAKLLPLVAGEARPRSFEKEKHACAAVHEILTALTASEAHTAGRPPDATSGRSRCRRCGGCSPDTHPDQTCLMVPSMGLGRTRSSSVKHIQGLTASWLTKEQAGSQTPAKDNLVS
jgi:hypothetical protein